ncbi:MAG: hypothetical protein SNF73_08785, partial [Rikenellaceae bacterium]
MVKFGSLTRRRYLAAYSNSKQSIAEFSRLHGINAKTLGNWIREDRLGMPLNKYRLMQASGIDPILASHLDSKSPSGTESISTSEHSTLSHKPSTPQHKATSHPLIAPVQITHSDTISHGSSSQNVLHLTLHLPSGVDAQI